MHGRNSKNRNENSPDQLQEITKAEWREQTGEAEASGGVRKEWRIWYRMSGAERKYAFEKLQVCFYYMLVLAISNNCVERAQSISTR
jgi:hypothetical protein